MTASAGAENARQPLTPEQQRLVISSLDLARWFANGLLRKGGLYRRCDPDTMHSAAFEGLCEAARRFDPSRGLTFGTYAKFYCVGMCQDAVAGAGAITLPRAFVTGDTSPRGRAFARAVLRPLRIGHAKRTPRGEDPPLDVAGRPEPNSPQSDELRRLDVRSRRILEMRLVESMTLEEAGRELGITRERVRQLEAKALIKLRGGPTDRANGRRRAASETTPAEAATLATLRSLTAKGGPKTIAELAAKMSRSLSVVRANVWALCRKRLAYQVKGGRQSCYAVVGDQVRAAQPGRRKAAPKVLAANKEGRS